MIKNKALVNLSGLMAGLTRVTGYLENSMAKALTSHRKAKKRLANGKTVSASNGSLKTNDGINNIGYNYLR